jgi:uncharacterized protein YdhG (YjbR/CyaY superfamily)
MTKRKFQSVDEYIASQPDGIQAVLELVRSAIWKALPGCDEVISYNMPTYKRGGEAIVYFAAWRKHYSIYPASVALVAEFKNELAGCTIHKNTLRFAFGHPVPVKLIGRIAKYRAGEVSDREKRTAAGTSARRLRIKKAP